MGKKIVIFNGSPRPNGNTSALIRAFSLGAEEAGNTVTTFLLDSMNIKGCKGCFGGGKSPDTLCMQKDDMEKIYPVYKEADIVVLASPLYYYTVSGQLKTAIDRLFAVVEADPDFRNPPKDCILLMPAEEQDAFGEALHYYNGLLKHIGWNNIGTVLAGGVNKVGDIEGKPVLDEARRLGAALKTSSP